MDYRLDRIEAEVEQMKQRMEKMHLLAQNIHRDLYGSREADSETGLFGQVGYNRQNIEVLTTQLDQLMDNFQGYRKEVTDLIGDIRLVFRAVGYTALVTLSLVGGNAYYVHALGGDSLLQWFGRVIGAM